MLWLLIHNEHTKRFPDWKKSAGISRDGKVFLPAAIAGKEKDVSFATLTDHTPVVIRAEHVYVPMTWLAQHYPQCLQLCWVMGRHVLDWQTRRSRQLLRAG